MTGVELAIAAFAASNALRAVAYLSQILRIASDARPVSCTTWSLFAISHLATVAYALVAVSDLITAAVFGINTLACVAILGLMILKRHQACQRSRGQSLISPLLPVE